MRCGPIGGLLTGQMKIIREQRMRRFRILCPLLAFVLLGAACGGDEALSKDEYIAQANAICEDSNAQVEAIAAEFFADVPEEPTPDEFAELPVGDYVDQYTDVFESQLADLRDLAAPEGDEDLLAALYDDVEARLRAVNALVAEAEAGDPVAIERLTSPEELTHGRLRAASTAFDEVDERATEYGLTGCSGG